MKQLSKNFTLEELIYSDTALRKGIDNTPNDIVRYNLDRLVENILQPCRDHWGLPIKITSGYRCGKLNRAVGGSSRSQHMRGQAADFTVGNRSVSNEEVIKWIRENLDFDQIILEYPPNGWVHVSYNSLSANRKEYLEIK